MHHAFSCPDLRPWQTDILRAQRRLDLFHRQVYRQEEGRNGARKRSRILPAGKRFEMEFCTVDRWHDGRRVEEHLFYDLIGLMQQQGIKG